MSNEIKEVCFSVHTERGGFTTLTSDSRDAVQVRCLQWGVASECPVEIKQDDSKALLFKWIDEVLSACETAFEKRTRTRLCAYHNMNAPSAKEIGYPEAVHTLHLRTRGKRHTPDPIRLTLFELYAIKEAHQTMCGEAATPEAPAATPEAPAAQRTPANAEKYPHYFIDVRDVTHLDVYAVIKRFGVNCPATAHAIKKLLKPGTRGAKDAAQDLREARDAIDRALELL